MANDEHVALLKQGVDAWTAWREANLDIFPDLSGADLSWEDLNGANLSRANLSGADLKGVKLNGANLSDANLSGANLDWANLSGANLSEANLSGANLNWANLSGANLREANLPGAGLSKADLSGANLSEANLSRANLSGAHLPGANLKGANLREANLPGAGLSYAVLLGAKLSKANLSGANLNWANLNGANLSEANLSRAHLEGATLFKASLVAADLTDCHIHGVSAWGLELDEETKQQNLVITPSDEPAVTVDNIEVAQFVYLLLHNQKLRDVIDTVTSKAVLILGRFTAERKAVLGALREELRKRNYLPILFDFDVPATRDITETVSLLARMARFIIADLTDPSSIPKELEAIVPHLAVPVQSLIQEPAQPFAMFKDLLKYDWMLMPYRYESLDRLLATLADEVIAPAEAKVKALEEKRRLIEAELSKPQ